MGGELTVVSQWRRKEKQVRKILEAEFRTTLSECDVSLDGTKDRCYNFDLVSPDGSIVGEIKTFTPIKNKKLINGKKHSPFAKISGSTEACFLLMHAKGAKKRILVLTNKKFYELYKKQRQAEIAESEGVEIRWVSVRG